MTLRVVEGFDNPNATGDFTAGSGGMAVATGYLFGSNFSSGRYGGYAYAPPTTGLVYFPLGVTIANGSPTYTGADFRCQTSSWYGYICAVNSLGHIHCYARISQASVSFYQAAPGSTYPNPSADTLLGSYSTTAWASNTFVNARIEFIVHPTAGEVHYRAEGSTSDTYAVTGVDTFGDTTTGGSGTFAVGISGGADSSASAYIDNLFVQDSSGSNNNSMPLYAQQVVSLIPVSDNTVSFTPSSGSSNYPMVNQTGDGGWDSDTTYNYSDAPTQTDLFNPGTSSAYQPLPTSLTITGVSLINSTRKTNLGTGAITNVVKSGGTIANGGTNQLTSTYTYFADVFETDPATGLPWTVSAAQAAQIGYKRTL